jgi:hypothetical protein
VIAVASAMLIARVYDGMAGLRSVDTRDALTKALTTGVANGLDLSVADALSVMRVGLYVAGVAAVVTGILGIFVLQRHATARVVLTAAAVPVVLTAPLAGGFLGLLIGGATILLWSPPARDWFAGRPPRQVPAERTSRTPPPRPFDAPVARPFSGSEADRPDQPPAPRPGWGTPAQPAPGPSYPPVPGAGFVDPRGSRPGERTPVQVRTACILTWVLAGLTAGLYTLVVAAVAVDRGAVLDLLHDNASVRDANLNDNTLVALIVAVSAFLVLWCLAAGVLAVLAWRRQAWAWILLLVSAGAAALAGLLVLPFSVAHVVGAATAFLLLLRAPVRAWFAGTERPGPPPPWQPPAPSSPLPPPPSHDGKPPVW